MRIVEGINQWNWSLVPNGPNHDTQILQETKIFELEPSELNMVILMQLLKTYLHDKFDFRDFHFLILCSRRPNFSTVLAISVFISVARLGCFQPHGLFSGFVGLVKFWLGWGLVGLDGSFFDFSQINSKILGCFEEKLGWF